MVSVPRMESSLEGRRYALVHSDGLMNILHREYIPRLPCAAVLFPMISDISVRRIVSAMDRAASRAVVTNPLMMI